MPLILLILGAVLLVSAIRNTQAELGNLFKVQFTGPGSFTAWAFAFFMLALLGTAEPLRPLARAFMVLLLLVMFLVNSRDVNLFTALQAQLLGRAVGPAVGRELGRIGQ